MYLILVCCPPFKWRVKSLRFVSGYVPRLWVFTMYSLFYILNKFLFNLMKHFCGIFTFFFLIFLFCFLSTITFIFDYYSFSLVAFPHLPGSTPSWPSLVDTSKQWDYYSRREKDRDRDRDRDRERDRDRDRERERTRERERERDHSPTPSVFNRYVQCAGTYTHVFYMHFRIFIQCQNGKSNSTWKGLFEE